MYTINKFKNSHAPYWLGLFSWLLYVSLALSIVVSAPALKITWQLWAWLMHCKFCAPNSNCSLRQKIIRICIYTVHIHVYMHQLHHKFLSWSSSVNQKLSRTDKIFNCTVHADSNTCSLHAYVQIHVLYRHRKRCLLRVICPHYLIKCHDN